MSWGIKHTTTTPYHPRLNGEVERFVQTFKLAMDKADPNTTTELQNCVVNFLARYRSTPHSVTNQSPLEILNGRWIRTRMDLLHPCQPLLSKSVLIQKVYYDSHTKPKAICSWRIRNVRAGKRWLPGTITRRMGNVMYKVAVEGSIVLWCQHANQLCKS